MNRMLDRVPDELYAKVDTDPKLAAAYSAADKLVEKGADIGELLGFLTPEIRAERPYLMARVIRGARYDKEAGGIVGGPPIEQLVDELGKAIYHPDVGAPLRVARPPRMRAGSNKLIPPGSAE